jgi:hypothetical protein
MNIQCTQALSHRHQLQVMFRPSDVAKYPNLVEASETSISHLLAIVQSGQAKGELMKGDPHTMTKAIWAMAHGVATVAIANRAEDSATAKMAIADQVAVYVGFLFDGLAL